MNLQEKLRHAEEEAASLRRQIAHQQTTCQHRFSEPKYDPILTPHMVFSHYKGVGSDPNPVYIQSGNDSESRWSRTCSLCGKVEHTSKRKVVQTEPDFG